MKKILTILLLITSFSVALFADVVCAAQTKYFETAEFLSDGIKVTNICRGISSYEDGKPIIVTVVEGSEGSLLQVVDVNAQKLLHVFNCGVSGTMWQGCAAPDGTVYCAVGNHLILYSPTTKTITDAGTVPTTLSGNSSQLIVGDNGVLYGSTVRYGNVYQYKNNKISTLATVPDVVGMGGIAYHSGYLWTGGEYNGTTGEGTRLYRVDPSTGALAKAKNPLSEPIKSIGLIYTCGEYLIVQLEGMTTPMHGYFYHPASNRWLQEATGGYKKLDFQANGMTDICQNQRFYLPVGSGYYHSINIDTLATRLYNGMGGWSFQRGSGLPIQCDFFEGDCFVQIQYGGHLAVMSPTANSCKGLDVKLESTKTPRRISRVGSDGRVYVTGFMGSEGIAYDAKTGEKESFPVSQGEGAVEYNKKMYIGSYPGAIITEFDMMQGIGVEGKQKTICDIEDDQDRPFGMDVADGKLLVGTIPTVGNLGGALTVIDLETYESQTYRNLVQDHGILTVTHKDNIVYFGTTAGQGGGVIPAEDNRIAHVVAFDLNTRKIVKDVKFTIPGVAENIGAVHGLRISPYDGKLYGTTTGIDFVMNPDTLAVERYHVYSSDRSVATNDLAQLWHEHYMQFYNGYLFRTNSILNPSTLEVLDTCSAGQFAGVHKGYAYFVAGNTDIYSASVAASIPDTEGSDEPVTWGYEWNYDNTSNWLTPSKSIPEERGDTATATVENEANTADLKGQDGTNAKLVTASKYGNGATTSHYKPTSYYGTRYTVWDTNATQKYFGDTEILVSTDFMVPHDNIGAYILTPQSTVNQWNFQMAFSVELDGTMAMVNGCRWGGDDGYRVNIGKVNYGEWYNLKIKYSFASHNSAGTGGIVADVYLNDELVVSGFQARYAVGSAMSFNNSIIAVDRHRSIGDSNAVDEGVVFDNTYIGNDMTILPTEQKIARVYDANLTDKTKLNVRFTQDGMKDTLTASDFVLKNTNDELVANVTDLAWVDNREVVLTLDSETIANTEYSVTVKDTLKKSFKTKLEAFWDFDDGTAKNFSANYRNLNSAFRADDQNSYQTLGKSLAVYFGGSTPSGDGSIPAKGAAGVTPFSENFASYTGPLTISTDIMIPNNRVTGGIVFGSAHYADFKGNVSIRSSYDGETYTGTKLYFNDTALSEIELKKWYNLTLKVTELSNSNTVIDAIYLDGTCVMDTPTALGTKALDRLLLLGVPKIESGRVTDQIAYYDNFYISPDLSYMNSKSEIVEHDAKCFTISAGPVRNEGIVFVAVYDDSGALLEVKSTEFDVAPFETKTVNAQSPDAEGTVRVFRWNDADGIKPFVSPNASFAIVN